MPAKSAAPHTSGLLTPCEQQVFFWIAEGKTRGETAVIIGRSEETVKKHLASGYRKLEVGNRVEAINKLREQGLLHHATAGYS